MGDMKEFLILHRFFDWDSQICNVTKKGFARNSPWRKT